jgi:hypothetical protein
MKRFLTSRKKRVPVLFEIAILSKGQAIISESACPFRDWQKTNVLKENVENPVDMWIKDSNFKSFRGIFIQNFMIRAIPDKFLK